MTAPRPFDLEDLAMCVEAAAGGASLTVGVDVMRVLLARAAVFEAAVAWDQSVENVPPVALGYSVEWNRMIHAQRTLRAAITTARDAENQPRAEEEK